MSAAAILAKSTRSRTGVARNVSVIVPCRYSVVAISTPKSVVKSRDVPAIPTRSRPKFWGNASNRNGTNHPHAVVYFGGRVREFLAAFAPFGIPLEMTWDRLAEFVPEEVAV